jgi:hypothetical protein
MVAGAWRSWSEVAQPGTRGPEARRLGCQTAMGRMRSHLVVVASPALDDGARLGQAGEHLLVQALVTEPADEVAPPGP